MIKLYVPKLQIKILDLKLCVSAPLREKDTRKNFANAEARRRRGKVSNSLNYLSNFSIASA